MCGRYVSVSSPTLLADRFGVDEVRITEMEPNYNVAPHAEMPVVAVSRGPAGARPGALGARALVGEGPVDRRPSDQRPRRVGRDQGRVQAGVREAPGDRAGRRLLRVGEDRRARSRSSRGSSAGATASRSRSRDCGRSGTTPKIGDDAPRVRTFTIITTDANELLAPIHDRMPVVLPGVRVGPLARSRQP